MAETDTPTQIAQRLEQRRRPQSARCAACGHHQEIPPPGRAMPSSLASQLWTCQRCSGQMTVTGTFGGDEPSPDEDIRTLLDERSAVLATLDGLRDRWWSKHLVPNPDEVLVAQAEFIEELDQVLAAFRPVR